MGNSRKRFHELVEDTAPHMTHSHASERRGYEAEEERQRKGGKKAGLSVRDRKNFSEKHRRIASID